MKLCLVCNFNFGDDQELCPKDSSKLIPLGNDPLLGTVLQERYKISSVIAKGSMGVVYKATQELIGREVAVKVLHNYLTGEEESLKRFHKEAKAASRLNHPNIITYYDYGLLSTGQPFIVMDLLDGKNLADLLKTRDYLAPAEALVIFSQTCAALSEAHKQGVIHRDIKPENIVLENVPERGYQIKVIDFGIAKFIQEREDTIGKITKTGTVCGSPIYMSPEQCNSDPVDHRSDIYSLGIVLYEMLTGKAPFNGTDAYSVMTMHVKDPPPKIKTTRPDLDFPSALEHAIDCALAKKPEQRYQSIGDFLDAVVKAVNEKKPSYHLSELESKPSKSTNKPAFQQKLTVEPDVQAVVAAALERKKQSHPENYQFQRLIDAEAIKKRANAATMVLRAQGDGAEQRQYINIPAYDRWIALMQHLLPVLLMLSLSFALFWVVANESVLHTLIDEKIKPLYQKKSAPYDTEDTQALINQNKLEEVRQILEKRKSISPLKNSDAASLNWVYVSLAKKEAQAKRYKSAVILLEQVSDKNKWGDEIKLLVKHYKKLGAGTPISK